MNIFVEVFAALDPNGMQEPHYINVDHIVVIAANEDQSYIQLATGVNLYTTDTYQALVMEVNNKIAAAQSQQSAPEGSDNK